jgi:uncharacterized repeat protein (TIGR04138 family)
VIELRLAPDLLARIREREHRYDEMAYLFVLGSIEFLQSRLAMRRHVSGAELALACRDHALEQYGLMARPVLDFWGIRRTEDLGRIVFTLVDVGLLVTQPGDTEADFRGIFDFDQAFSTAYGWPGVRSGDAQAGGGAVLGEEV